MSEKLKQLTEKRAKLAADIKAMADALPADGTQSAEQRAAWDTLNRDYDQTVSLQTQVQRAAEVEALEQRSAEESERRAAELRQRPGADREEDEKRLDLRKMRVGDEVEIRFGDQKNIQRAQHVGTELRAQSVGTDSAGGFLVPEGFGPMLERAMLQFGPVRSLARILRTDSGNPIPLPGVDDTANSGESGIKAENGTIAEQALTFNSRTLGAYKISSGFVLMPEELIEDAAFMSDELLASILGERLGRKQNTLLTTGTGSSQPLGAVPASSLGKTAGSATAITFDEIIDLYFSVDGAYRNAGAFMARDTVIAALRKLKGSDGHYLWSGGIAVGQPDLLYGKPLLSNNDMPAATTGLKSVVFGDFSKMLVREVRGIRLKKLVERFADNDQVGFVALLRFDSRLWDAGASAVAIKHLIQA